MVIQDDFFDLPTLDVFPFEVDTLVISMHKAALHGVEIFDQQKREAFATREAASDPAAVQERWWWEDEVRSLKNHAGNMGLVSLILLFENWIEKRQPEKKWRDVIKDLPDSPLTVEELEEMKTTRNSIIHHRGKADFTDQWGNAHTVHDRFLDFENPQSQGRVAVDQSLLTELASKVTRFVELWNRAGGPRS